MTLGEVRARGVSLHVTGGRLCYRGRRQALTPDFVALLAAHKAELLAALEADFEERAAILEYEAGLPRAEAEMRAAKLTGWTPGSLS